MTFTAEIKQVQAIKTVSLDRECKIVLITPDTGVLELGKDSPDVVYKVTIEREG